MSTPRKSLSVWRAVTANIRSVQAEARIGEEDTVGNRLGGVIEGDQVMVTDVDTKDLELRVPGLQHERPGGQMGERV